MFSPCLTAQDFTDFGVDKNSVDKLHPLELESDAPDFRGVDQEGRLLTLDNLVKKGPLVMIFYRGEWCPVCNTYLAEFQDNLNALMAKGANVVAITPESDFHRQSTVRKNGLSFPILIDSDQSIMNKYGVAFKVSDDYQKEIYTVFETEVADFNMQEEAVLPVPATYIIGQDKKVKWVQFDVDYHNRASTEDISKALSDL